MGPPKFCRMLNPFRYFNSSPEIIRLAVMMYVRYPLSLRQVEDQRPPLRMLDGKKQRNLQQPQDHSSG